MKYIFFYSVAYVKVSVHQLDFFYANYPRLSNKMSSCTICFNFGWHFLINAQHFSMNEFHVLSVRVGGVFGAIFPQIEFQMQIEIQISQ